MKHCIGILFRGAQRVEPFKRWGTQNSRYQERTVRAPAAGALRQSSHAVYSALCM